MSDRKMLYRASAAAFPNGPRIGPADDCPDLNSYRLYGKPWNPLADDGDALRLLVLLGMSLTMTDTWVGIETPRGLVTVGFESCSGDKSAATRRVIVMAAGDYYEG